MKKQELPTSSCNRDALWDIEHIQTSAIPNFIGWKESLADVDAAEAPNTPEMWENQFPFYALINGDMLTIDMRDVEGPNPVRYFSHELEMLHGSAVAPDFFTFITEMSRLGFAGTEWASWMPFGKWTDGDIFYLKADSEGGTTWRRWLEREPTATVADEPPPVVVGDSAADKALLEGAVANDLRRVSVALEQGAQADAVWNRKWPHDSNPWQDEFSTAISHAIRNDNAPMLEILLKAGADLNTRHSAMAEAATTGSPETARWLVAQGARVNGWKNERYWPIHRLMTQRNRYVAPDKATLKRRLQDEDRALEMAGDGDLSELMRQAREVMLKPQLDRQIDAAGFLELLRILLEAGADPDARWDNGTTMLFWAEPEAAHLLILHGADVDALAHAGERPLHFARTPEMIQLLVENGADINAVSTPTEDDSTALVYTPLQASLLGAWHGDYTNARKLLELGADPKVRDLTGRSTLCYCTRVDGFRLIQSYGLDPLERLPDGSTLLHNLLTMTSVRAAVPKEVAMLDFLLGLGIDINATDAAGRTMLHLAAERSDVAADIKLLLDRGADPSIKDADGKRPTHLVRRSLKDVRELLN